jgi:hypothetical protein
MNAISNLLDEKYLNSPREFHLEMPLYLAIDLNNEELAKRVYLRMTYWGTVDAYCIWCEDESIFKTELYLQREYDNWLKGGNGLQIYKLYCIRNNNHEYETYYFRIGNKLQKVGQIPSVADFQIPQAQKYRKILGEDQYKEFARGIGLFANSVGIGSFVYLRRIFEKLIEEAHVKEKDQKEFPEGKYVTSRMDVKIDLLKNDLPEFLVKNKSIYSILSKGIHELSEEECLEYFTPVKIGIEQILDEKIEQHEKAKKAKIAEAAIQKILKKISNPA